MLVSHDRALLRAVCDEFWLVSRGGIAPFDGDLDDYQRYLLEVAKQAREARRQATSAPTPVAAGDAAPPKTGGAQQRKHDAQRRQQRSERLRPLRKELEQNERQMAQLQAEKQQLETQLTHPMPPAALADTGRRLRQVSDALERLETRWLELGEALEAASAEAEGPA